MSVPNAAALALARLVNDREQEINEGLTRFAADLERRGVDPETACEMRELAESIHKLVNLAEFP